METFAQSIVGGSLNSWIQETYWLWPVMEISHFIGLSLLLGGLSSYRFAYGRAFPQL